MGKSAWLNGTNLRSMQRRGNWLQCFIQAHILAPNQPLEMLTWVELLPRLLVLQPLCHCATGATGATGAIATNATATSATGVTATPLITTAATSDMGHGAAK